MDNLRYLLSAYFHQDWDHAHTTWEGVVDDFMSDDATTVAAVPGEVDHLLASTNDDAELGLRMQALGCDYAPDGGDRAWLLAVRDHIQSSLAKDGS